MPESFVKWCLSSRFRSSSNSSFTNHDRNGVVSDSTAPPSSESPHSATTSFISDTPLNQDSTHSPSDVPPIKVDSKHFDRRPQPSTNAPSHAPQANDSSQQTATPPMSPGVQPGDEEYERILNEILAEGEFLLMTLWKMCVGVLSQFLFTVCWLSSVSTKWNTFLKQHFHSSSSSIGDISWRSTQRWRIILNEILAEGEVFFGHDLVKCSQYVRCGSLFLMLTSSSWLNFLKQIEITLWSTYVAL